MIDLPFRFVVDRIVKGRAYPAFAKWQARPYTQAWRQFGNHWPYTIPLRLEEYCRTHQYALELYDLDAPWPPDCYYPIGLAFFDFSIDYIDLLPTDVVTALRHDQLRLLFMYHEGDNPRRIKQRLDHLCQQHALDINCYRFVSSNTEADRIPNFITFHDFELWYYQRNITSDPSVFDIDAKQSEFLLLNRLHKSWRATVMADLLAHGILDNSLWSYCEKFDARDCYHDNPIEIDSVPGLRQNLCDFATHAVPKYVDDFSNAERNDHSITPKWHQSCAVNLVLESQFDVDQSGGAFLTEKTFKPIKHAQMFLIVGASNSLQTLRQLGYRVFDTVIDNSFDSVTDSTQRWIKIRETIQNLKQQDPIQIAQQSCNDIQHNQDLFLSAPHRRLNTLAETLCQLRK